MSAIDIITWNYDLALEQSYHEFCSDPDTVETDITNSDKIIRLNGRAGAARPTVATGGEYERYTGFEKNIYYQGADEEAEIYGAHAEYFSRFFATDGKLKLRPLIHFAWEDPENVDRAVDLIKGTNILVVIGYSFPFFNRMIDKKLIGAAAESAASVFLQNDGDLAAKERFEALANGTRIGERLSDTLEVIKAKDYFYIPHAFSGVL